MTTKCIKCGSYGTIETFENNYVKIFSRNIYLCNKCLDQRRSLTKEYIDWLNEWINKRREEVREYHYINHT